MKFATLLPLLLLAACGPETPRRAASDNVTAGIDDAGAAWPLLLHHCLRSPGCDPMSDFGGGAGEASNAVGSVAWFVQTRDRVLEGAEDYGAKAELSLFGARPVGGKAGRPLTIDELPDNLGGSRAKRSTLTLEYRAPSGAFEPYFLQFTSPHITQLAQGLDAAKLEIVSANGVLFSTMAGGMDAPVTPVNGGQKAPEAMYFYASRNLRDEPLPQLMAALARGDSLSVRLSAPNGDYLLQDALYSDGYASAVEQVGAVLADPEIDQPIVERCARFAGKGDESWKLADVTPALLTCDPRLPEQRR